MNLIKIINDKIKESSYETKKDVYEEMRDIIGENCSSYTTFSEILKGNRDQSNLSMLEGVVLAGILNIDLNLIGAHIVESRKFMSNKNSEVSRILDGIADGVIKVLNEEIHKSSKPLFSIYNAVFSAPKKQIIHYYIHEKNWVGVVYRVKLEDEETVSIENLARLCYLDRMLDKDKLKKEAFENMDEHKKVDFIIEQGKLFYELYPEEKPEIRTYKIKDLMV